MVEFLEYIDFQKRHDAFSWTPIQINSVYRTGVADNIHVCTLSECGRKCGLQNKMWNVDAKFSQTTKIKKKDEKKLFQSSMNFQP